MNQSLTIHKGFDIAIARAFLPVGIPVNIEPMLENIFTSSSNFAYIWLVAQGSCTFTNTDTGETVYWEKFDSTLSKPLGTGEWQANIIEDLEVFCINQHMNLNKFPIKNYVETFILLENNETELVQGTQLFLGSGEIQIDDQTFVGPKQIKIKTQNKTIKALTDVAGYIIK
jgi:hypothetical protein